MGDVQERSKPSEPERPGFWSRQFAEHPTPAQNRFDVVMGMLMPVFCLLADPIVFRGYDSILTRYRWVAYTFIGVEILILGVWLRLRPRLSRGAIFFAAPLLGGGAFALAIGIGILPVSLPGALVLIGILGFTPFFTSLAFLRNGGRALRMSRSFVSPGMRTVAIMAGLLFIGTPSLFVLSTWYGQTLPHLIREAGTGLGGTSRLGGWIYQGENPPQVQE